MGNSHAAGQEGDFLSFASICYTEVDDIAATLGKSLQGMGKAAGKQEDSLSAAMTLLTPAKAVATKVLAMAVAEAFHVPCSSNLRGEALAAMAVAGRREKDEL